MEIEDRIREAVREDRQIQPSVQFHSRVMANLPARTRSAHWPTPAWSGVARYAAIAAILAVAVATVGLPLMQSKSGIAGPGGSATTTSTVGAAGTTHAATAHPAGFTSTGTMVTKDGSAAAVLLLDGRVLLIDGHSTAELYDPATGKFGLTGSMATDRASEPATRLLDGRVLVTGGILNTDGTGLASAELYDPKSGKFSPTGSMSTARYHHTATLLPDGRVLITGGYHVSDVVRLTSEGYGAAGGPLASAELYDPRTGKFTRTGSMIAARFSHTAVSLADGRVLVMGGLNGVDSLASAEIYDPASGKFVATGSMPDDRQAYSATLLSDGRVLISGGFVITPDRGLGRSDVTSAELYDPATGRFTATGAMVEPRNSATATRLTDGRVLVAGGASNEKGGVSVASAELYDPATGTFSAVGSLTTPREMQEATLLLDGRVLIVGGVSATAAELASAEIYQP